METNANANRHCKQKKLVNRTVSFENELVPLNGRIMCRVGLQTLLLLLLQHVLQ